VSAAEVKGVTVSAFWFDACHVAVADEVGAPPSPGEVLGQISLAGAEFIGVGSTVPVGSLLYDDLPLLGGVGATEILVAQPATNVPPRRETWTRLKLGHGTSDSRLRPAAGTTGAQAECRFRRARRG
jgi:hypothetical protein